MPGTPCVQFSGSILKRLTFGYPLFEFFWHLGFRAWYFILLALRLTLLAGFVAFLIFGLLGFLIVVVQIPAGGPADGSNSGSPGGMAGNGPDDSPCTSPDGAAAQGSLLRV
jgi:hypothetical protein